MQVFSDFNSWVINTILLQYVCVYNFILVSIDITPILFIIFHMPELKIFVWFSKLSEFFFFSSFVNCFSLTPLHLVWTCQHGSDHDELYYTGNVSAMFGSSMQLNKMQNARNLWPFYLYVFCSGNDNQDDCHGTFWKINIPSRVLESLGLFHCLGRVSMPKHTSVFICTAGAAAAFSTVISCFLFYTHFHLKYSFLFYVKKKWLIMKKKNIVSYISLCSCIKIHVGFNNNQFLKKTKWSLIFGHIFFKLH